MIKLYLTVSEWEKLYLLDNNALGNTIRSPMIDTKLSRNMFLHYIAVDVMLHKVAWESIRY